MGPPLYLYDMDKQIYNPPEIIKVRAERDTIIVRLPRWFVGFHKLTSKDYLVFRDKLNGNAELVFWEDHLNAIGKTTARRRQRNPRR